MVQTMEMWVQVEVSSLLMLMLTLHWRIWDVLRPEALRSSSSCSLFRLASIRSSSSSSPCTCRLPSECKLWSLESTGFSVLFSSSFQTITHKTEVTYLGACLALSHTLTRTLNSQTRYNVVCNQQNSVNLKQHAGVQDRAQGSAAHNSLVWPSEEMSCKSGSIESYANLIYDKMQGSLVLPWCWINGSQ